MRVELDNEKRKMVQPTILKRRHTLKGKSLLPVIRRLKGEDPNNSGLKDYARISASKKTSVMSMVEVEKAVKDITGESMNEVLEFAGKDVEDEGSARMLLHFIILHANDKEQPDGQNLVLEENPTPVLSADEERETAQSSGISNKKRKFELGEVEERIKKLEKGTEIGQEGKMKQIKEKVKSLCSQPQPSEALILLSLDELSRLSRLANHNDMDLYEELYRQCSRLQGKINMANVCLTVLGGKEADAITKAINKCLKGNGNLDSNCTNEKNQNVKSEIVHQPKPEANTYSPMPYSVGFPPYPFMGPPVTNGPHFGGGYNGYQTRRPYGRQYRPYRMSSVGRGACLFCESTSHYVKDCELMKQAKRK